MNVRLLTLTAALLATISSLASGQTITSPATPKTIVPWSEYATTVLRDPWDMNRRTDIGWFTWGVDQPTSNMTSKRMTTDQYGNTVFTAVPITADPSFFLLDTPIPGRAQVGKVGSLFPIDTSKYTRLLVKMRFANAVGGGPVMQLFWSRASIYNDPVTNPTGGTYLLSNNLSQQLGIPLSATGSVEGGRYIIYSIPIGSIAQLQALNPNITKWRNVAASGQDVNWGDAGVTADSLRIGPANSASTGAIDIDWARLVAPGADAPETVSWTGGSTNYDIVVYTSLDDCSVRSDNYSVLAYNRSSGYQFNPQNWPNGLYYLGLRNTSTHAVAACSTGGSYTVVDYPAFDFTSPSPTGSSDDFASVFLNNPWDFASASDIDASLNITGLTWGTVPAERRDGTLLGNVPLMFGASTPGTAQTGNVGDPYFFPMYWSGRGYNNRIDANRYRLFTLDLGVDRARDLVNGSVLRLAWHVAGETFDANGFTADALNVTSDITLFHMHKGTQSVDGDSANFLLDRVQIDLADRTRVPLEASANGSPSRTGWANNPLQCGGIGCNLQRLLPFSRTGIDSFRIDPHEFASPTGFWVGQAKLTAHERTGGVYAITWSSTLAAEPASGAYADPAQWRVRLYAVRTKPETSFGAGNASPMTPATTTCTSNPGTDSFQITANGAEPTLGSGTYPWNTNATAGLVNGGLYFICAGLLMPGQPTPVVFSLSTWPVIYSPGANTAVLPRLYVEQSTVHMARTAGVQTPAQTINVDQIGGNSSVSWVVDVCADDPFASCSGTVGTIAVSSTSGSGTGSFTVQLQNTGTPPPSAILRIQEASAGSTSNSPQYVHLLVDSYNAGATQPPFGQLELPAQGATGVQGALGVGGWVLDDVGVSSVKVFRNCLVAVEPTFCQTNIVPGSLTTPVVYLGDAVFLAGARPDVEAQFPTYPQANRAGFGMLILTNMMPRTVGAYAPNGGQGPVSLYVVAYDVDGHATLLGRSWNTDHSPTSVTMDNDTIAKPFGVIDTPAHGGDTAGAYVNFGWALTPDDGTGIEIPTNQTANPSMFVFVDGAPIGVVTYNQCRGSVHSPPNPAEYCDDDVSNIFGNVSVQPPLTHRSSNPSRFRNLNAGRGPIGYFVLDTTAYANGLHSIAWGVYDNRGRVEGVGSRLFTVTNSVTSGNNLTLAARINPELGRRVTDLAALSPMTDAVGVRLGVAREGAFETAQRRNGTLEVHAKDLERVELSLPSTLSGSTWQAYAVRGGQLRPLPTGASLDPSGRFYWQTVAGFYGGYDFVFIRDSVGASSETLPVHVTFEPKFKAQPSTAGAPVSFAPGASSQRQRR